MERLKLWLWYYLFFLPGCPDIGQTDQADCLYVQAFGRSMFTDKELQGMAWLCRESPLSDEEKYAKLHALGFYPGDSNVELAIAAWVIIARRPQLAIMQWEVGFALWQEYPCWYNEHRLELVALWPSVAVDYFPTIDVTRQSFALAKVRGKSRPRVLANSWMIIRAALIVAKLEGHLPIVRDMDLRIMDPSSIQRWTRSWWRWLPREFIGRCVHVVYRWV
jgi:hypothetical protein